MGEGEKRKFLSFSSLPFSLPSFPFSPETPDTQATTSRAATQLFSTGSPSSGGSSIVW